MAGRMTSCTGRTIFALWAMIILVMLPNLAASAPANRHAVAVIIGNSNYPDGIPAVDFAGHDADAFRKFVIDVLGYDPENIIDLRDATKSQMQTVFGNNQMVEGRVWRYLDPKGRSDLTVFYSGHGVPGLKDRRGYLLPVDADPESPEINGYSVDTLLGNMAKLKTRTVTIFLDACFSGDSQKGQLVKGTSGLVVVPKLPDASPNMTIITASQGDQVASWDMKARHGLFTRHLLEALYGKADGDDYGNGDGKVALSEVREYLDYRMTRAARREFGRHQNAWIKGKDDTVLVREIKDLDALPIIKVASTRPVPVKTVKPAPPPPSPPKPVVQKVPKRFDVASLGSRTEWNVEIEMEGIAG